jgi:hypothetical protein
MRTRALVHAASQRRPVALPVLDGVGQQFVERQRDRDRLGLGQQPAAAPRRRPAPGCCGRRCAAPTRDGLQHMRHAQRPAGAHLQAVDLRDGLHLAHRLGQHRATSGWRVGVLLQQPGHALQVVLDAVVHLAHQHLALRDGRLQPRLFGGALLGHVAGHQQQLRRGPARPSSGTMRTSHTRGRSPAGRPPAGRRAIRGAAPAASPAARVSHSASANAAALPAAALAGRAAQHALERLAEEGAGHLVELQHAQARVEQRDGQRRGLDHALQRGLRLRDADFGLAPALDVQQREGQLGRAGRVGDGDDGIADDPELAPVAAFSRHSKVSAWPSARRSR